MAKSLLIAGAPIHPARIDIGIVNTGGIDMKKFRKAVFVIDVGEFGSSSTVDMKLQESADHVTFTDLAGPGVSIAQLQAAAGDNRLVSIEARTGQLSIGKRYIRASVTVGTSAAVLACIPFGVV